MNTNNIISFIRETFQSKDFIPLHAPVFRGNEKKYLEKCIDSTFVSSVGEFVDGFEALAKIGPCISIFGSARTSPPTLINT